MFEEIGLNEPPHTVRRELRDARRQRSSTWDYDTVTQDRDALTVDKNGNDATQAGFDPKNIVQYGFEPQRDDIARTGRLLEGRQLRRPPMARPSDPGRLGRPPGSGSTTGSGRTTSAVDYATFQNTDFNPDGYPFCTGKVAMSRELPLVALLRDGRRRQLGPRGDAGLQRARRPRRSTPTRSGSSRTKHPDEAFTVLQYLLGDAASCSSSTAACRPARPSRTRSFSRSSSSTTSRQADRPADVDWQVAIDGIQSPTSRTSSRTCPPTTSRSTCSPSYGTQVDSPRRA